MRSVVTVLTIVLVLVGSGAPAGRAVADQSALSPVLNAGDKTLQFDWPALRIGTGEYEEGPTGVTVIHFPHRALAAVDVRGGSPGTVFTDYLRLYERPDLDAVVFSGGSAYGLEAVTAVATALKDDGVRGGWFDNIAEVSGAIIYDFGDRRLNEVYPDKRLAQAAIRAARPGIFPLGAHGAGRFAVSGGLFGCDAYSGQGAAFRQIGDLKIAAFVVVNSIGVVTTRDGRVAACYPDQGWPQDLRTADLVAAFPANLNVARANSKGASKSNTTVSLLVINRKIGQAALERLAMQVHGSMARAIQPFATQFDGDVLYAASTEEFDPPGDPKWQSFVDLQLDVIASEVMWDAVLASVPAQPAVPSPDPHAQPAPEQLRRYAGLYAFSPIAQLRVTVEGRELRALASGPRSVYAIGRETPVTLQALSSTDFTVPGRHPMILRFDRSGTLVINPGHWEQVGRRQPD